MILTLIVKKRETENGKKFNSYSTLRGEKWYSVKFVKDCPPPQVVSIEENVKRAFISLKADSKFDIRESDVNRSTVFVETYEPVTGADFDRVVTVEKQKCEEYRKAREKARMDFLTPVDGEELPF